MRSRAGFQQSGFGNRSTCLRLDTTTALWQREDGKSGGEGPPRNGNLEEEWRAPATENHRTLASAQSRVPRNAYTHRIVSKDASRVARHLTGEAGMTTQKDSSKQGLPI
ncbi:hypothetical protein HPB50_015609 [Hyalomma asiaticum]|uniref:Uncharacterized protein n=1 Tax=Hyalomma asiaticum TaxID=266040 RepID=A0ACB7SYR2_HYAAI|nr:hypothetical protein HPB50_015609 [Hyalomma asiaticum]